MKYFKSKNGFIFTSTQNYNFIIILKIITFYIKIKLILINNFQIINLKNYYSEIRIITNLENHYSWVRDHKTSNEKLYKIYKILFNWTSCTVYFASFSLFGERKKRNDTKSSVKKNRYTINFTVSKFCRSSHRYSIKIDTFSTSPNDTLHPLGRYLRGICV